MAFLRELRDLYCAWLAVVSKPADGSNDWRTILKLDAGELLSLRTPPTHNEQAAPASQSKRKSKLSTKCAMLERGEELI